MPRDQAKREYFNALAGEWDLHPHPPDAPRKLRQFCQRACPPGAGRVLDCGCGTGLLVTYLQERLGPGAWVVELDFARAMLQESKRKHRGRLTWVCADACRLPFGPASFDAVLMFGLLPHVEEPVVALREALRVLRPGGQLAVGHLMSSAELNAFHSQLEGPVREDRLLPAGELAGLLDQVGAETLEAWDEPGFYCVLARRLNR